MIITDEDVVRDSMIIGNRHMVRLTHTPTQAIAEYEGRLPTDRNKEEQARYEHRQKVWTILQNKVNQIHAR